ncbi:hypothetical protein GCM10010532_055200 [Dactylosporangium siamense]|uniref:AMIN-like domain-containing protein n=1 Tax=Dactylosporangium siamense TaxID=685454 RepID=A0A919U7Y5_9ACTN|nr:hypothetical protein Dsi01nite_040250 [Dactylosporangium siamense]
MTRLSLLVPVVLLAGCAPVSSGSEPQTATNTSKSTNTSTSASGTATTPGWTVPTRKVSVSHDPAVPPVPVLVEVRAGDHADEGYERVTFAFQGPLPSYTFQIVPQVTRDGSGDPVTLPGTTFLSIVFTPARSQAGTGPRAVGYRRVRGYEQAGDYEGYVSYGIGLNGPDGATVQVRTGESTRADGTNVVALDIRV